MATRRRVERQLRTYFHIRHLNFKDELDDEESPRYLLPIPFGTSAKQVRYDQVTSRLREEEELRRAVRKYRAFDLEARARERIAN